MNSSFACISILVKGNISKPCLINFLNELSSKSLRGYLKVANICDGNSNKIKSNLIEMIIYGCINGKIKNKIIDEWKENKLFITKLFLGYGSIKKRKKDMKPYTEDNIKCSVNI